MIQITTDAKNYFDKIAFTDAPRMDAFHLSFLLGVHALLKNKNEDMLIFKDLPEKDGFLPRGIPKAYEDKFPVNIGLMLEAQIIKERINRDDKEELSKFLNIYLSHKTLTRMTDNGDELMSAISYKGFEIIKSQIEKPSQSKSFIKLYYNLLKKYIN